MSIWDSLSDKRSQQIESGTDITFNQFFVPYYRKTITEAKPRRLIDIGCGTGHLLLHLRELSEQLVGIEPSSGMINIAEKVLDKSGISLCQTRIQDFYPGDLFDLAISHFSLQADGDIEGFIQATARILKSNALFIFTVPHPCFWNDLTHFLPEEDYFYLTPSFAYGKLTVQGQLTGNVPYFHRPLKDYFNTIIRNGFNILSFDEIHPDLSIEKKLAENWKVPRFITVQCEKVR